MRLMTRVFCAVALTTLVTVPVLAKVAASAERPGNFIWPGGTVTVPLTSGGALFLSFSGKGRHMINYSAECETEGDWLSIQIIVDGVPLSPTAPQTADAFCSDHNNNNVNDGFTTAHYSVATDNLALGVHTVRILATVVGAGQGWLGDSSLVVTK
jgi:hypothetical protein